MKSKPQSKQNSKTDSLTQKNIYKNSKGQNTPDLSTLYNENKEQEEQERLQKEKEQREKEEKENQLKLLQSIRFSITFIYRREQYILKNEKYYTTFAQVKDKISKKLSLPQSDLIISYKDKEITDNKINVYDLFKQEGENYFSVRKKINKDNLTQAPIISSSNFIYTVYLDNVPTGRELTEKVDYFFNQMGIEKNCIIEPIGLKEASVSFAYNDLAFDFKRYIMVIKKTDPLFQNTIIIFKQVEKRKKPKIEKKTEEKFNRSKKKISIKPSNFLLAHEPYTTYEECKRKEELESKKKWINKNGFISSVGNNQLDYI